MFVVIVLLPAVDFEIGPAAVNAATGVRLLFFSFTYRGRKIGLRSPGFEPGVPNVRNLRH